MTRNHPNCCSLGRGDRELQNTGQRETNAIGRTAPADADDEKTNRMVRLLGGTFQMGTDSDIGFPEDGEGPVREVTLEPFYIDKYTVTNAEFIEFVQETGYTTDAERFGWSFVFKDFLHPEAQSKVLQNVPGAPWWKAVEGANWLRPEGGHSTVIEDRLDHPVTHVSWYDAQAYAQWANKRLPTEAEWEYAARGGLENKRFPWGDTLTPGGKHKCNIWQGEFPNHNTGEDGYSRTAPVNEYDPNGYNLYNLSGNVWEWCQDWFSPDYHTTTEYSKINPTGPDSGNERVIRGGSYLCHRSWCNRYRVAARSHNTPNSSTGNIGFRCVVDTPQ